MIFDFYDRGRLGRVEIATGNIATNIKNFRAPEKKASKQASSLCSLLFLLKHLHFTM